MGAYEMNDVTAPSAIGFLPENGAENVAVDTALELRFSENVEAVQEKFIKVWKADDTPVASVEATDANVNGAPKSKSPCRRSSIRARAITSRWTRERSSTGSVTETRRFRAKRRGLSRQVWHRNRSRGRIRRLIRSRGKIRCHRRILSRRSRRQRRRLLRRRNRRQRRLQARVSRCFSTASWRTQVRPPRRNATIKP